MEEKFISHERRERLLEMVSVTNANSRAPLKHAWLHIDRARKLVGLDNEMACFRAITAEEEAATSIFHAVRQIGYENAKHLNKNFHAHKAGLWPLIRVISAFMHDLDAEKIFDVKVDESKGKLILRFPNPNRVMGGYFIVDPPLQMGISPKGGGDIDVKVQAESLASLNNQKELKEFIKAEANIRNELLYANQNGIPSVSGDISSFIDEREKRVMALTYTYLMIAQHPREKQNFVQLALNAYLKLLAIDTNN